MKKTFRKISFVMMYVFFLFSFIMSSAIAVSVGNAIGSLKDEIGYMGEKVSNPAFGFFITGLIITFSVTAFWAFMLEHAKNVEKTIDTMYRESKGLPALPDSEYSALPVFLLGLTQPKPVQLIQAIQLTQPMQYAQTVQPQYAPQQYEQPEAVQPAPVQPIQYAQPMQPAQPIQPITTTKSIEALQPIPQTVPAPQPVPAAQPIHEKQTLPHQINQSAAIAPNTEWTCGCGNTNIASAKFCCACGSPKK